jgi:hypothetical protein
MKPGDHPDFFRFAPPPGTSRESTIVLRKDGTFLHDGEVVEHRALHKALASWIALHPDDGRLILTNGYDWTYFAAEDAPMHVTSIDTEKTPPELTLFDDSTEPLAPETMCLGEDGVVHCRVRGGTLEARFSRHAQTQLAPLLVQADGGSATIRVGEHDFPLPPRPPR